MNVTASRLGEFKLFAGLDDQTLAELASHVHERTFEPGEEVAPAGEPCQAVCLVVRGIIRTRRLSMEGREYVLEYIRAGQAVGLVPAVDGGLNLAMAEALTRALVYLVPCEHLRQIVREHLSAAVAVLESLSAQVRELSDTVEDLALHTVRARLARFLLAQREDGPQPSRHWTQEGYVRRERGRLVVADRAGLEREAMYV
jgi:CRP-like cAMP-binding protein